MKVVILAGGFGTRLAEETEVRPKPMIEVGGRPLLWHVMKHYSHYGFNEFIIALGYKGDYIKRYFLDYFRLNGSFTLDLATGQVRTRHRHCEDWTVHLMDTGLHTNTGGRVRRLRPWLNERFLLTYGDGVCDVDIPKLIKFHESHGRMATCTAVRPPARFGGLLFNGDLVTAFTEKPQVGEGWINGGYMVLEPELFSYLPADETSLESNALTQIAAESQLAAYKHDHFWQCMDTLRDYRLLQGLWDSNQAPWKIWETPDAGIAEITESAMAVNV